MKTPENLLGCYVKYKSKIYLVTEHADHKVRIISPIHGKKYVKDTNVVVHSDTVAKQVPYRDTVYLVTPYKRIFSTKSHKQMMWNAHNGNRKNILKLAGEQ